MDEEEKAHRKSKITVNAMVKNSNLGPLPISAFYGAVAVCAKCWFNVPEPRTPTNDPFSRRRSTNKAQKSSLGALKTVQSRMAAKNISCA